MASGRFLSVSIAEDDKLSRLSLAAELLYIKTIPHLDRDGMISGKPGFLWGKICPLREDLFGATAGIIDEWLQVGLVIRIATDEGPALFFPGFLKNNNLPHYHRERPSRFPAPPGYIRTETGLIKEGTEPPKKPVKKPKPPPVLPPSNGNHVNIQDEVQDNIQDEVQEIDLQEQEQEEDQEQDQAKEHVAAASLADSETDDPMALVRLAYQTVCRIGPPTSTPDGKANLILASNLLDQYGYQACYRMMATLKERHNAMIKANKRGISAPLQYLRTIMDNDESVTVRTPSVLDFVVAEELP